MKKGPMRRGHAWIINAVYTHDIPDGLPSNGTESQLNILCIIFLWKLHEFCWTHPKKSGAPCVNNFVHPPVKKYVKLYTSDIPTKKIGGDLGWIDPNTYSVPEIGQAIKYIESNVCSPPINSSLGFHLIWVEDIKPGGRANLEDHRFEIESIALNRKKINFYNNWINEAKKGVFIKMFN